MVNCKTGEKVIMACYQGSIMKSAWQDEQNYQQPVRTAYSWLVYKLANQTHHYCTKLLETQHCNSKHSWVQRHTHTFCLPPWMRGRPNCAQHSGQACFISPYAYNIRDRTEICQCFNEYELKVQYKFCNKVNYSTYKLNKLPHLQDHYRFICYQLKCDIHKKVAELQNLFSASAHIKLQQ